MEHYKSWSGLNGWLSDCLCEEFRGRIRYFLTRYHKVHNAYGRAAILLDDRELVCFEWMEMYHKEFAVNAAWHENQEQSYLGLYETMKPRWDADCTYDDIPGAKLYMYEQWGHGLYEEAKDFNQRVMDFLK